MKLNKEKLQGKKNAFVLTVIPVLFTIIFASVYSNTYVTEIPMAVFDMDQSSMSRDLIDAFGESGNFEIAAYVDTQEELEHALLAGDVYAGLVFPPDFEKEIRAKKSPSALLYFDGTNILIGSNAYSYAASIMNTYSVGIQMNLLGAGEMVPYQAEQTLTTLSFTDRTLYVPNLSNFIFIFAGFLGIFVQQTFMSVSAPALLEERKKLSRLREDRRLRKVSFQKMASKLLYHVSLTFITLLSCVLVAHYLGGYPLRGNLFLIFLIHLVFVIDMIPVTVMFSLFFDDKAHCTQMLMMLSIPALLTSGYVWPAFAMPPYFMTVVKCIWPIHYYVNPMRQVLVKGAGFAEVSSYIAEGLLFACVWIPICAFCFWRKVRIMKKLKVQTS